MQGENHPDKKRLREGRERAIAVLTDGFARDTISLDAFESLVGDAYACTTVDDLEALLVSAALAERGAHPLATLGASSSPTGTSLAVTSPAPSAALVAVQPRAKTFARAIFGSTERKGRFAIPDQSRVEAIFGSVEVDLREVDFPPGVTEVRVKAVFGSIEIVVPAHIAVECAGSAIFGSFEGTTRVPALADPDLPILRVVGDATFASIEIHTRPPEQVIRDARAKRLRSGDR